MTARRASPMPLGQTGHWRLILMLACYGKPRTEAAVSLTGAKTGSWAAQSANRRFQSGAFKRNREGVWWLCQLPDDDRYEYAKYGVHDIVITAKDSGD